MEFELVMILVSGATSTLNRYPADTFGALVVPRAGNCLKKLAESSRFWAADNDAFGGWDQKKASRFSLMLGRICRDADKTTCLFVSAPDVVGDSKATLKQFSTWEPIIHSCRLPVALVAQDGLIPADIPWDDVEAVFIGGTTEFKMSREADRIIEAAKCRDKHVHVGRVNTSRRLKHFWEVCVDSIDGTFLSRWPDIAFAKFDRWLSRLDAQFVMRFTSESP